MTLHALPQIKAKRQKRLGQGHGSGRVKTSGRGTKGQKARHSTPLDFEGGGLALTKRMPFLRGKGRNKPFIEKPLPVNLTALNSLPKGSVVDVATLIKHKLVDQDQAERRGVKILGEGEVTIPLIVKVPFSEQARKKIEAVSGKVEPS